MDEVRNLSVVVRIHFTPESLESSQLFTQMIHWIVILCCYHSASQQSNHLKAIKSRIIYTIQGNIKRNPLSTSVSSQHQKQPHVDSSIPFHSTDCLDPLLSSFPSMNNAPGITNIFWWNCCNNNRRQYSLQSSHKRLPI